MNSGQQQEMTPELAQQLLDQHAQQQQQQQQGMGQQSDEMTPELAQQLLDQHNASQNETTESSTINPARQPKHPYTYGHTDPSVFKEAASGFVSGAITEPMRGFVNLLNRLNNRGGESGTTTMNVPTEAPAERDNPLMNPNYMRLNRSAMEFNKSDLKPQSANEFYQKMNLPNALNPEQVNQTSTGAISSLLGSLAVSLAMPAGAMGGATTIPAMIGKSALAGAAEAPLFAPDTDTLTSMATGGALGAAGGALIGGVPAGINAVRKMGATAKPEEIKAALSDAALAGVKLPAAELLDSPMLKQFQGSMLSKVPTSGMAKEYQNIGNTLKTNAAETVNELANGENLNKVSANILDSIKSGWKEAKFATKAAYDDVQNIAQATGQKVDLSPLYSKLGNLLKEHSSADEIIPGISKLASNDKVSAFMKQIQEGGIPSGVNVDFSKVRKFDEFLNKANSDAIASGDRNLSRIITELKKSLNEGIDTSIESSSNPQLLQAWNNAKKTYAEKLTPYQEKDILKFTQGKKGASQIIPTFIKSGTWENPEKMKQLTSLLPDEMKSPLAALFLSKGQDVTAENVVPMLRAFSKMGKEARQELIPSAISDKLDAIMRTGKRLGAQKDQMFIPKTGEQAASSAGVSSYLAGLSGAAAGGAALGGVPGGLLGAGVAATIPPLITRYLMSPKRAQSAIKALEKERK